MTGFYIVSGIAMATAIITTIAFNYGASKGSHDLDHLDPGGARENDNEKTED